MFPKSKSQMRELNDAFWGTNVQLKWIHNYGQQTDFLAINSEISEVET